MIQTFMAGRLPPYGAAKVDAERTGQISKDAKICLRNREHITWFIRKSETGTIDEDDADEEASGDQDLGTQSELVVVSSLNNERSRHMTIDAALDQYDSDAFSMGVKYKELLDKLEKSEDPITVSSLTEGIENGDSIDPLLLATALNNVGAITISK